MRNVIAIIDDGIFMPSFPENVLEFDLEVNDNLEIGDRHTSNHENSHATYCARILFSSSINYKIGSIKIFKNKYTSRIKLLKSLEWCYFNQIKIIHLSVGSIDFFDFRFFDEIIMKLFFQGTIVVSALDNDFSYTVPGMLDQVISVSSYFNWEKYSHRSNYIWHPNIIVDNVNFDYGLTFSNSFATSYVTLSVAKMLLENEMLEFNELLFSLGKIYKTPLNINRNIIKFPHLITDNSLFIVDEETTYFKFLSNNIVLPIDKALDIILTEPCYIFLSVTKESHCDICVQFISKNLHSVKGVIFVLKPKENLFNYIQLNHIPYYIDKLKNRVFVSDYENKLSIPVFSIFFKNVDYDQYSCKRINDELLDLNRRVYMISMIQNSYLSGVENIQSIKELKELLLLYKSSDFCDGLIVILDKEHDFKVDLQIEINGNNNRLSYNRTEMVIKVGKDRIESKAISKITKLITKILDDRLDEAVYD